MKITFLGQSGLAIETMGKHLVVDPFVTGNPKAAHINIDELPADYMLLTHGHQDHVLDAEAICKRTGAKVISNYEIVGWYGQKEIAGHPLHIGGKATFEFGTLKYVAATHGSMLPDGSYGGNPGGFVLWNEEANLYIAGDTGLTMDMKLIPMTCPKLDLAILPIGDNFTMGYEDAVIAAEFIDCSKILGCHYDTFPYIEIDKERAKEHFTANGKELILLDIGESIEV